MNFLFRLKAGLYSAFMNKITMKNAWIVTDVDGNKKFHFKHTPETLKIIKEGGLFGGLGENSRTIRELKKRKLFKVSRRTSRRTSRK